MSVVRFQVTGPLSAFHVSEAAGVVLCLPYNIDGPGVDDLGKVGPGMVATVHVEITLPVNETAEGEAES